MIFSSPIVIKYKSKGNEISNLWLLPNGKKHPGSHLKVEHHPQGSTIITHVSTIRSLPAPLAAPPAVAALNTLPDLRMIISNNCSNSFLPVIVCALNPGVVQRLHQIQNWKIS